MFPRCSTLSNCRFLFKRLLNTGVKAKYLPETIDLWKDYKKIKKETHQGNKDSRVSQSKFANNICENDCYLGGAGNVKIFPRLSSGASHRRPRKESDSFAKSSESAVKGIEKLRSRAAKALLLRSKSQNPPITRGNYLLPGKKTGFSARRHRTTKIPAFDNICLHRRFNIVNEFDVGVPIRTAIFEYPDMKGDRVLEYTDENRKTTFKRIKSADITQVEDQNVWFGDFPTPYSLRISYK